MGGGLKTTFFEVVEFIGFVSFLGCIFDSKVNTKQNAGFQCFRAVSFEGCSETLETIIFGWF